MILLNEANKSGIIVSFIIVIRNGAKYIPGLFEDFLMQDYPLEKIELLIVDGESTDNTKFIAEKFAYGHPELCIKIINNSKRILSSGWNIALTHVKGEIILRVDAHSRIPSDFISNNVKRIFSGEYICGGYRESLKPDTLWGKLLYMSEVSRFGGGAANFRNPGKPRYVDTLAHAAYHRYVFKAVGGYDERLVRNQDNEIHYRMKQAGFKFFFDSKIHSYHLVRETLKGLLRQKFGNGMWVGLTIGIQPRCFSLRHFVPSIFLFVIILTIIFGLYSPFTWSWLPLIFIVGSYLLGAVLFAVRAFVDIEGVGKLICLLLPSVFFLMHIAYGIGTLLGLIKMPFFIWHTRNYKIPHPIR